MNHRSGTGMLCVAAAGCSVTFPLWQVWQSRHHPATSEAHPCHTNLLDTRRLVARIPGCASPWMAAKTADLKAAGTSGRATPVDTSHRTSAPWICTHRTCRAGLAATFCTSGQDPCTAAIAALSTSPRGACATTLATAEDEEEFDLPSRRVAA